jgi:hypothetical protein
MCFGNGEREVPAAVLSTTRLFGALLCSLFCSLVLPSELSAQRAAVNLGSAGNYVILSKTGITDVPPSPITGNIGASPITGAAIHVSCAEVTGRISAVDAAGPAPCSLVDPTGLGLAIGDAGTAYADAAGRTIPDFTELGAGNISGKTLVAGLYKWSTGVLVDNTGVTLTGDKNAVWIFQIAGDLTLANTANIYLAGGARATNIFWQVGGPTGATLGTTSSFYGTILSAKQIIMNTGATLVGRALAQTQVTLQSNTVTIPPCTFDVTPSPAFSDSSAQSVTLQVVANVPNCAWNATSSGFAATSGPSSGIGSGQLTYAVSQNTTGFDRTASLTIAAQLVPLTQRFTQSTFSDVLPGDPDFDAASLMRQNLITAGCATQPTLQYCPNQNVTRGQIAIFLVRAIMGGGANEDAFPYTAVPYFTDVPLTHPYFKWIQKMKDLGITAGCGVAQYCPDGSVTRDQMAAFIIRARYGSGTAFAFPSAPLFTDVPAGNSFFKWIQKMKQAGITGGCTATTYCPGSPVTRGQMAIFIMRGGFNLLLPAGTPMVSGVSPSSGGANTVVSVTITGLNTNFLQGTTTVTAGSIPGTGINVTSSASLTAQFSIPANTAAAPVSIIATTGPEEAVGPNLLTVNPVAPH